MTHSAVFFRQQAQRGRHESYMVSTCIQAWRALFEDPCAVCGECRSGCLDRMQ